MSEKTELLKKYVLTTVGATTSVDRIKTALNDAVTDLVKVGQDLLEELETKGKDKADSVQDFLKNFQTEARLKTSDIEQKVSTRVQEEVKKAAKDLGLVTREEFEEVLERVSELEEPNGTAEAGEGGEAGTKRSRRGKKHAHEHN
jgi:polyhydroxyalkanoate synthesis regulator phasin